MLKKNSGFYVPELDGLRGLSIISVMLSHASLRCFRGGFIFVDVFFVLSGFLITSLLIKEFEKSGRISLKNFYMRRVLRLAPALIILLILFSLMVSGVFGWNPLKGDLKTSFLVLFYSANWARAFSLNDMGSLGHTWSLSIEEQFYILWPVAFILLLKFVKSKKNIAKIIFLTLMASILLRVTMTYNGFPACRMYNGLDTRMDSLLTGCLTAVCHGYGLINMESRIVKYLKYFAAAGLMFLIGIIGNIGWSNINVFYWILVVSELSSAILVLNIFFSENSRLNKIFSFKPLIWVGSLSYGLYLWHVPVFDAMLKLGYSGEVTLMAGSLISVAIASLSFYGVEKRILTLKNRLR